MRFLANLLCFFAIFVSITSAGCPSMCQCSDSLLSCTSESLEGVPNLESLEIAPQTIDLSDNSIYSILATDFSFDGVENVEYLHLNNNRIVDIHEKAFSELKNVKEINLNTNSLDNVPPMFVADNKQLVSLDLSNNFFDLVTPEIYSESLEALDLSSTKISSFTEANIKYLPKLKILNLSYNRLKAIDPIVFANSPYLLAVDLTGNFWNCDQKTIDLFNYLTDKGFTDVTDPVKCVTEDGFYQDIYTSAGPVDIFSISLEGFEESPSEPKQEAEDSVIGNNEEADDPLIEKEPELPQENANGELNEELDEDVVESADKESGNVDKDEVEDENEAVIEGKVVDEVEGDADDNGEKSDDEGIAEGTSQQDNDDLNEGNVDDNYLGEEPLADVGEIQDDNQEAINGDEALGDLLKDIAGYNTADEMNDDNKQVNNNNDDTADESNINEFGDKSLEEIILQQTGKKNPEDITDSDVIDAINQLLKEEETGGIDDYADDYWENGEEFVGPEKTDEKAEDDAEEEAFEQAKKVIEDAKNKEKSEAESQTPEMGISVIREDQYIVLLERESTDQSQYSVYLRSNISSLFGILAIVFFILGILFGLYAIRESFSRKRRRDFHGSTNVLINKWSQDLA